MTDEQPGEHGEVAVQLAERAGLVHADLSVGANVAAAQPLQAMAGISSPGVKLHGSGFLVTPAEAAALGSSALVHDYRNGRDLTDKPRGVRIIDAFGLDAETLRAQHPAIYQWLLERVKPERDQNNRATYRDNWWIFGEPRRELRPALAGLPRYIATVETSKHRTFQFLDASILPDNMLIAIAVNDALALGVLSSQLHTEWALATGGTLEDRPRYNKSRCFETFPFPDEDTGLTPQLRERIAQLAEQIDAHRKRVLAPEAGHTGLTLTGIYNVLAALREGRALTAKEKTQHAQGLVGVLRELHDELDAAVLAAYGLPATASTDDILAHLVQLNTQRAQEEAQGRVRWLRPDFQNPQNSVQKQELLPQEEQAPEADLDSEKSLSKPEQTKPQQLPWPPTLPEQVRAVADALAASPIPLTLNAIEQRFKGRGPWKKGLPTLLQTLEALGRAQAVATGGEVAWRG
ncbi:type IIL restriction-modification enzyme MmeI [Acidovorax carolinensis]|uniref:type IIL restriction-modification enzyme MmeI n=1 Tax=Acidovorax carolinensis TaxID=553814 RepID=UPI001ABF1A68|nr:type IIL restriction-modification enzyme MmeI [Acidovorax carolinensis]